MGLIGFISPLYEFEVFKYVKDNVLEVGGWRKYPSETSLYLSVSPPFTFTFPFISLTSSSSSSSSFAMLNSWMSVISSQTAYTSSCKMGYILHRIVRDCQRHLSRSWRSGLFAIFYFFANSVKNHFYCNLIDIAAVLFFPDFSSRNTPLLYFPLLLSLSEFFRSSFHSWLGRNDIYFHLKGWYGKEL